MRMNLAYVKNVLWLGGVQAAQYVLPVISVPYLTRTLGPTGYGLSVYTISLAAIFGAICDYGFGWTATKSISIARNDIGEVRRIFVSVMATKILLFVICAIGFLGLVVFVPSMRDRWSVHVLALAGGLGSILFPVWLFQGLERMAHIAWFSLSGRIATVAAIFLFVRDQSDVWLAVFLQMIAPVLTGTAALFLARRWIGGSFSIPTASDVKSQLREGRSVFITSMAITLYTAAQTTIVGTVGGATRAGYFGAADKFLTVGKTGFGVLSQAAMPRVSYYSTHDPAEGLRFIRRLLLTLPIGLSISLIMYSYADFIVGLLFGSAFVTNVAPLFRILSPIPFILNMSMCFASLFMFNYGLHRQWSVMIISACTVSLSAIFLLHIFVPIERAAAFASLITETFVLVVSAIYFFRSALRKPACEGVVKS
jgi:PST family polysaccharide transporter